MSIEIRASAEKPPLIHILPQGTNFSVPLVLDFYVLDKQMYRLAFSLGVVSYSFRAQEGGGLRLKVYVSSVFCCFFF